MEWTLPLEQFDSGLDTLEGGNSSVERCSCPAREYIPSCLSSFREPLEAIPLG